MPTTFFSLPRELRDIIYSYILVSPTGIITPIFTPQPKRPSSLSPPNARFTLLIAYPELHPSSSPEKEYSNEKKRRHDLPRRPDTISLSLPRTNRQIHLETAHLFWTLNTFAFTSPHHLILSLKSMTQIPSRLLRSIHLTLPFPSPPSHLSRAFRLLASRSRHGDFRSLTLEIGRREFIAIENCRVSGEAEKLRAYDEWLGVLREGMQEGWRREVRLGTLMKEWRVKGGLDHETVREVHEVTGGRMWVNGELEWVDYAHVGNCAGVPQAIEG